MAEHNGIKDRTVILEQGQKTLFRLHDENRNDIRELLEYHKEEK